MATSIRTFATVDYEGNPARGVKVTEKNISALNEWLPVESELVEDVKQDSHRRVVESKVRLRIRTKKGWRVARVGDVIVKVIANGAKDDFVVVKANS